MFFSMRSWKIFRRLYSRKETKELNYIYWNTACESLIGVLKEDIIGKTDYDVLQQGYSRHLTAQDRLTVETGELRHIPEECVDVPGEGASCGYPH